MCVLGMRHCSHTLAGMRSSSAFCHIPYLNISDDFYFACATSFMALRDHPLFSAFLQEYTESTLGGPEGVNPVVCFKNVGLSYSTCTWNKFKVCSWVRRGVYKRVFSVGLWKCWKLWMMPNVIIKINIKNVCILCL